MSFNVVTITCTSCMQTFTWDLLEAPLKKAHCPYCSKDKKLQPRESAKKPRTMLTNAERYPENKDCMEPEYPQDWFLDYHCKSLNLYQKSPHLRATDKGATYRALDQIGIADVHRTQSRIKVTLISYRQKLADCQSLYGGGSKGLLDILVRKGWVHDDNPKWCDLEIKQEKVLKKDMDKGAKRGTRVLLEVAQEDVPSSNE